MSRLALGTVQFGLNYGIANQVGQVALSELKQMLQVSRTAGLDTLDTAIAYGDSEQRLGMAGVDDFRIVTKLSPVPDSVENIRDWVFSEINSSISRLNVPSLYGVLLHRPEQLVQRRGAELFSALEALRERGLTRKIGVSVYSPSELDKTMDRFSFDLVQAPFNLLDRRMLTSGWMQRLKEKEIELHTRSAFLQGLLLMPRTSIPGKFSKWNHLWDQWQSWLATSATSALQTAVAYPLSFSEIDRVVVGADSVHQLTEILGAAEKRIDSFPELVCEDELLITPSRWMEL